MLSTGWHKRRKTLITVGIPIQHQEIAVDAGRFHLTHERHEISILYHNRYDKKTMKISLFATLFVALSLACFARGDCGDYPDGCQLCRMDAGGYRYCDNGEWRMERCPGHDSHERHRHWRQRWYCYDGGYCRASCRPRN
uniref:Uncharacterized protein n=1 Tax=Romanomermis culicivorax TaxID=13658 RepID=A0A915J9S7_ROMCU